MKKTTRNNFISLTCALALVAVGGGVALHANHAKADELNVIPEDQMLLEEPEFRLKKAEEDDNHNGLRFVVKAPEATELPQGTTKTGTLVIPTELLEGELTVDTADVHDFDTTAAWNVYDDGAYSYAYFWNMSEFSYNVEMTYRAYIVMGGETYYTETATTSLAEVALDFMNKSTDEDEKAVAEQFLLNYNVDIKDEDGAIATVPVKYGSSLVSAADYVEPTKAGHILDWGEFDPNAPVTGNTEVTVNWVNVADSLSFNSEDSLKLMNVQHSSGATLVEEADGTKAVEFTFSNNDGGVKIATINLGSVKVKDIDVLTIRFKITAGAADDFYGIYFNDSDTYMYVPGYGGSGSLSSGLDQYNKVMNDYGMMFIPKAALTHYFGTDDVALEQIRFMNRAYKPGGGITTMRIDFIELSKTSFNTLKAGTKDYIVADFNTQADALALSTKAASYSISNGALYKTQTGSWQNGGVEVNLPTALAVNDLYSMTFRWKTADAITNENQLVVYAYDSTGAEVAYVNCNRSEYVYHTTKDVSTVEDGEWMVSTWTLKAYVANGALVKDKTGKSISKILLTSESNCSMYVDEITYRKNSDAVTLKEGTTDEYVLADFKQAAYAFTNYSAKQIFHTGSTLTSEGRGIYFRESEQSRWAVFNLPQTVRAGETITIRVKITGAHLQGFGVKADGTQIDWGYTLPGQGGVWGITNEDDGWITATYTPTADIVALHFYTHDSAADQANRFVVFDTITYKPAA